MDLDAKNQCHSTVSVSSVLVLQFTDCTKKKPKTEDVFIPMRHN